MGREELSGKHKPEHAARELSASGGSRLFMGAGPQDLQWEVARNDPEGGHEGLWATWWLHSEPFSRLPYRLKDAESQDPLIRGLTIHNENHLRNVFI